MKPSSILLRILFFVLLMILVGTLSTSIIFVRSDSENRHTTPFSELDTSWCDEIIAVPVNSKILYGRATNQTTGGRLDSGDRLKTGYYRVKNGSRTMISFQPNGWSGPIWELELNSNALLAVGRVPDEAIVPHIIFTELEPGPATPIEMSEEEQILASDKKKEPENVRRGMFVCYVNFPKGFAQDDSNSCYRIESGNPIDAQSLERGWEVEDSAMFHKWRVAKLAQTTKKGDDF